MSNSDLAQFEFRTPNSSEAQKYRTRTVFCLGNGPGVVLMHELPGLTDFVPPTLSTSSEAKGIN
jgi:hypothetical protein